MELIRSGKEKDQKCRLGKFNDSIKYTNILIIGVLEEEKKKRKEDFFRILEPKTSLIWGR